MNVNEKLTADIATVERRIAARSTELKHLQDQWLDWEAANLRTLIGGDKRMLAQLRGQLAGTQPAETGVRRTAVFIGSNS